jgi:hypothetical protein
MKPKTPKARGNHSRRPSPGEKTPGLTKISTALGVDRDLLCAFIAGALRALGVEDEGVSRYGREAMARYSYRVGTAVVAKKRR